MASTLEQYFTDDVNAHLMRELGDQTLGSYTALDGTLTSDLTIYIAPGQTRMQSDGRAEFEDRAATIAVAKAALSPAVGGVFTVDSRGWTVTAPPKDSAGLWECSCEDSEQRSIRPHRRDA